jgi:hypothetical protein
MTIFLSSGRRTVRLTAFWLAVCLGTFTLASVPVAAD